MTIATCPKCHRPVDSECRFCIEDDPVEAESVPLVTHDLPLPCEVPCGDDIPTGDNQWAL